MTEQNRPANDAEVERLMAESLAENAAVYRTLAAHAAPAEDAASPEPDEPEKT